MKYPNNYVVFDFETTGLDHLTCKVLEIGCLKIQEGKPDETYSKLINWGIPVPEKITEITGITQDMVDKEGILPEQAINEFKSFISGFTLIGHNIKNFDLNFLSRMLDTTTDEWKEYLGNYIDTAIMYKAKKIGDDRKWNETFNEFAERIINIRSFVKFNVGIACEELQIDKSGLTQHRAMADVILTNEIYKKLI